MARIQSFALWVVWVVTCFALTKESFLKNLKKRAASDVFTTK